jgi:hypothetical protein
LNLEGLGYLNAHLCFVDYCNDSEFLQEDSEGDPAARIYATMCDTICPVLLCFNAVCLVCSVCTERPSEGMNGWITGSGKSPAGAWAGTASPDIFRKRRY